MRITALTVGAFESTCYLIVSNSVWILDPGDDAGMIRDQIESVEQPIGGYLLTHGHADHLSALSDLLIPYPAPVYLHPADSRWAFSDVNQIPPFYTPPAAPPPDLRPLHDGDMLDLGGITATVIATPGHTPGSVCYHLADDVLLFTGDTLFNGSVGRTDLPGGDGMVLRESLKRLMRLPEETKVYPGHGPTSSIADELRFNPFMRT